MKASCFLGLILLLLAAQGCTPLTPSQVQPSAPAPASTLEATRGVPSPALPTPTELPPMLAPTPDRAHPILVFPPYASPGGFLLGAAQDGRWLTADAVAAVMLPQETYALYSTLARQGNAAGGMPEAEPICPSFWSVSIEHPAGAAAAVDAEWDALPRTPQEMELNDPVALQQVRDYLIAHGIAQPEVKIQRILRVDLEGDGSAEWLVAASRFAEETGHDVGPGDYSIVLLYREGQAALPVVSDRYTQGAPLTFPDRYTLSAVLDLNGDGQLEILVAITGWEKTGALAYALEGATPQKVLEARCP